MASKPRLEPLARAVLRTQSDERLVALAREGREPAFAEIVRRYRPPLLAFASAYVAPDVAEDVVQDSLVSSWKSLLGTDSEIKLKPWLYTIVRNRALNAKRDARPYEPIAEEIDGVRTPSDVVLEREELARVVAAVTALPEGQRQALVHSALDGRTHDQIAAVLDTSPASVRGLIHRARLSVRHGVGAVLPLPVVRMLIEVAGSPGTGEAAGGAVAAGVAGGATAIGGGATKAVAVIAAVAVAAGTGVAIEQSRGGGSGDAGDAKTERPSPPGGSDSSARPGLAVAADTAGSTSGSSAGSFGSRLGRGRGELRRGLGVWQVRVWQLRVGRRRFRVERLRLRLRRVDPGPVGRRLRRRRRLERPGVAVERLRLG